MRSDGKTLKSRFPLSFAWPARNPASKKARRNRFRRRLAIESLEERLPFAIDATVDVSVRSIDMLAKPDIDGYGNLYFRWNYNVTGLIGGFTPLPTNVANPVDFGNVGFHQYGYGGAPILWRGTFAYSANQACGSIRPTSTLELALWDNDASSEDDQIDIGLGREGLTGLQSNGRTLVLRQDQLTGAIYAYLPETIPGLPSRVDRSVQINNPEYGTHSTIDIINKQGRDANGPFMLSTVIVRGDGNALGPFSVNQVAAATVTFEIKTQFMSADSDDDGLYDIWENQGFVAGCGTDVIPDADSQRKDIYVAVDAMEGFAPSPLSAITAVSNSTPIVVTAVHHGLTTGATVQIRGVQGNTAANNIFVVTRLSNDTFSLDGSSGNGTYFGGGEWTINGHSFNATSLDLVVDAFARAPVANPNGTSGIKLHIRYANTSLPLEDWTSDGQSSNPSDALGEDRNANGVLDSGEDDNNNGALDDGDPRDQNGLSHFQNAIRGAISTGRLKNSYERYAMFADTIADDRGIDAPGAVSGLIGRAYSAGGFAVTLGAFPGSATDPTKRGGYPDEQASVFMHLLGHSLGLFNGGGNFSANEVSGFESPDFKPNYPSVMNSLWVLPTSRLHDENAWRLDYSSGTLPSINESAISETAGLGSTANGHVAIGPVNSPYPNLKLVNASGPVDINHDGDTSDVVSRDLNGLTSWNRSSGETLTDYNDWQNLRYGLNTLISDNDHVDSLKFDLVRELAFEDLVGFENKVPSKFSITDSTVVEGANSPQSAAFSVTMDHPLHTVSTVHLSVVLSGTASAADVVVNSGTLTFQPGETSKTISVTVLGDLLMERDETYAVILSDPTGSTALLDNYGLGTIVDNDKQPLYPAQTGPLDVTFDQDGQAITDIPDTVLNAFGTSTADSMLDSNGRLLLFGSPPNGDAGVKAVRYLPNGMLDPTFGNNGVVSFRLDNLNFRFFAGAVYQSPTASNRDKLLLVGTRQIDYGVTQQAVVRLNVDGTLDTNFGQDGKGWITFGDTSFSPTLQGVAIYQSGPNAGEFAILQNEGIGYEGLSSTVYRYLEDGYLDTTFGTNGKFAFQLPYPDAPAGGGNTVMTVILIDPSDRILLGGYASQPGTYSSSSAQRSTTGALIRLNPNGGLDSTFGSAFDSWMIPGATFTGINPPSFSGGNGPQITDLALQSDGKIVASIHGGQSFSGRLARFDGNGVIDFVSPNFDNVSIASSVAADSKGHVYIGGYTPASPQNANTESFSVSRYLSSNGSLVLDREFDPIQHDGLLLTPQLGAVNSLQFAADGSLIASGTSFIPPLPGTNSGRAVYAVNKFDNGVRNDLSVAIQQSTATPYAGYPLTYTIRVRNTGDDAVFPSIQDVLPIGTVFVSLSLPSSDWVASTPALNTNGTIIATRRTLKQTDGEQVFTLVVRVNENAAEGLKLTNTVTTASNYFDLVPADNTASVTSIVDPLLISVSNTSIVEGNAGTTTGLIYVTLNRSSSQRVTVNYATFAGGSASASDFDIPSGMLEFSPGETSMPLAINVVGDTLREQDETIVVNLTTSSNANFADNQALITILDDEWAVTTQPTPLDVTFGSAGIANQTALPSDFDPRILVIDSSDRSIVVGNSNGRFTIARFNPNGALDPSFGSNNTGIVISEAGFAITAAIYKSGPNVGKLLVAGATQNGGNSTTRIRRYNADGNLDTSFGIGGTINYTFWSNTSFADVANSLSIYETGPNAGKFIAGGFSYIVRFNADGFVDRTFDILPRESVNPSSDIRAVRINGALVTVQSVQVTADNKILFAGTVSGQVVVGRYEDSGALDLTFNAVGYRLISQGSQAYSLSIDSGGRFLVSGTAADSNGFVARLTSIGALDATFGTNGLVIDTQQFQYRSALEQPDGRIVILRTNPSGLNRTTLRRLNADGTVDNTFDTNGSDADVEIELPSRSMRAVTAAKQSDGKVVSAIFSISRVVLARVIPDRIDLALDVGSSNVLSVSTGEKVTFVLGVKNVDTSPSNRYVIVADMPANTTFISATGDYWINANKIYWRETSLGAGGSRPEYLVVQANVTGPLVVGASVIGSFPDKNLGDNNAASDYVQTATGLVSYWKGDGNADDYYNRNPGTALNGTTFPPGFRGQAFGLDGINDYVSIPDSPSLRSPSLTVSTRFKSEGNSVSLILAKPLSGSTLDSYAIYYANGALYAGITPTSGGFLQVGFEFTPTLNTWYQTALTFDSATKALTLYLDGVARASTVLAPGTQIAYDASPLLLGADNEGGTVSYFWHGSLDDVLVFNQALSAPDLMRHYIQAPQLQVTTAPPTISSNAASVISNNNQPVAMTGRFNDPDGNNAFVLLTSSIGTVLADPNGDWTWTLASAAGLAKSQVVTVTANDGHGRIASTNFLIVSPSKVEKVEINGDATQKQRSLVQSIKIMFDSEVSTGNAAFEVKRIESVSNSTINNGATTALNQVIPLLTPEVAVVNGKTQVVLRFAGPGNAALRSLEDGKYRLNIVADRVAGTATSLSLDGDNNGVPGGDYVYKEPDVKATAANPAAAPVDYFFRLFGDQDGDRDVDNTDYLVFSKSLNKTSSQTGYLWYFDIDGASGINSTDLAAFNLRRNKIFIKGPTN